LLTTSCNWCPKDNQNLLYANRAQNRTAIRTQNRTRVDGPFIRTLPDAAAALEQPSNVVVRILAEEVAAGFVFAAALVGAAEHAVVAKTLV
jgi:hypothetical protein